MKLKLEEAYLVGMAVQGARNAMFGLEWFLQELNNDRIMWGWAKEHHDYMLAQAESASRHAEKLLAR